MPANLENSAVTTQLEKVSFHSNPKPKKGNTKEYQGEIRKPLSVINARKVKKTIECERLEISYEN